MVQLYMNNSPIDTATAPAATPVPVGHGTAGAAGARKTPEIMSISAWLQSVHPNLATYASELATYGYEDTGMLVEADEEDLKDAFGEVNMKKPHRKKFMKEFNKLTGQSLHPTAQQERNSTGSDSNQDSNQVATNTGAFVTPLHQNVKLERNSTGSDSNQVRAVPSTISALVARGKGGKLLVKQPKSADGIGRSGRAHHWMTVSPTVRASLFDQLANSSKSEHGTIIKNMANAWACKRSNGTYILWTGSKHQPQQDRGFRKRQLLARLGEWKRASYAATVLKREGIDRKETYSHGNTISVGDVIECQKMRRFE